MRLGVVSDIHGNLPALQAVVADATAQGGVDAWVNLGDILSGPLWPAETADWLLAQDPARWSTIAGNHERWLLHRPPERLGASDRHAAERLRPAHRAWLAGPDAPAMANAGRLAATLLQAGLLRRSADLTGLFSADAL